MHSLINSKTVAVINYGNICFHYQRICLETEAEGFDGTSDDHNKNSSLNENGITTVEAMVTEFGEMKANKKFEISEADFEGVGYSDKP